MVDELLHGEESAVPGARGCTTNRRSATASVGGSGPLMATLYQCPPRGRLARWQRRLNRQMSSLRAIVEFPFRILKCQFGRARVRYRGLRRNADAITTRLALAKLNQMRRQLTPATGSGSVRPQRARKAPDAHEKAKRWPDRQRVRFFPPAHGRVNPDCIVGGEVL